MTELDPFLGPQELEQDWLEFVANKLGNSKNPCTVQELNALNILAFGVPRQETPEQVEAALKAFVSRYEAGNYTHFREGIARAAEVSEGEKVGSPLNKAITKGLMESWLALETARHVPTLPDTAAVEKSAEWLAHEELKKSPEGAILESALHATSARILMRKTRDAYERYGGNVAIDTIASDAYLVFLSSLYRYEGVHDATFFSYLTMRLDKVLGRKINQAMPREASANVPLGDGDGKELIDLVADARAQAPEHQPIIRDQIRRVEQAMPELLTVDEQRVLGLAYGLREHTTPHGPDAISAKTALPTDKVRTLLRRALYKLRTALSGTEPMEPERAAPKASPLSEIQGDQVTGSPDPTVSGKEEVFASFLAQCCAKKPKGTLPDMLRQYMADQKLSYGDLVREVNGGLGLTEENGLKLATVKKWFKVSKPYSPSPEHCRLLRKRYALPDTAFTQLLYLNDQVTSPKKPVLLFDPEISFSDAITAYGVRPNGSTAGFLGTFSLAHGFKPKELARFINDGLPPEEHIKSSIIEKWVDTVKPAVIADAYFPALVKRFGLTGTQLRQLHRINGSIEVSRSPADIIALAERRLTEAEFGVAGNTGYADVAFETFDSLYKTKPFLTYAKLSAATGGKVPVTTIQGWVGDEELGTRSLLTDAECISAFLATDPFQPAQPPPELVEKTANILLGLPWSVPRDFTTRLEYAIAHGQTRQQFFDTFLRQERRQVIMHWAERHEGREPKAGEITQAFHEYLNDERPPGAENYSQSNLRDFLRGRATPSDSYLRHLAQRTGAISSEDINAFTTWALATRASKLRQENLTVSPPTDQVSLTESPRPKRNPSALELSAFSPQDNKPDLPADEGFPPELFTTLCEGMRESAISVGTTLLSFAEFPNLMAMTQYYKARHLEMALNTLEDATQQEAVYAYAQFVQCLLHVNGYSDPYRMAEAIARNAQLSGDFGPDQSMEPAQIACTLAGEGMNQLTPDRARAIAEYAFAPGSVDCRRCADILSALSQHRFYNNGTYSAPDTRPI